MPEMGTATQSTEVDEVAQLFEAYKLEHETSTLTLPQFRQVGAEQKPRAVQSKPVGQGLDRAACRARAPATVGS